MQRIHFEFFFETAFATRNDELELPGALEDDAAVFREEDHHGAAGGPFA